MSRTRRQPVPHVLPYVRSTIDDQGTQVLFDRGYRALWIRRTDGTVEKAAPLRWSRWWRSEWLYDGTLTDRDRSKRAAAALTAWGIAV